MPCWWITVDIDEKSTEVLKKLPFDKYNFKVITIEHDYYIHGDKYRNEQRKILYENGYLCICPDVLVPISSDTKPNCSFEDWWIHKTLYVYETMQKLYSYQKYPQQIIEKFK